MSQSLTIESQHSPFLRLTLYASIIKPRPRRSHCMCEKGTSAPAVWLGLLTPVYKDSFESPQAGLFTSNNANEADVCATLMCCEEVHMARKRWLNKEGLSNPQ